MEWESPYPMDRAFLWTPEEPNGTSGVLADLGTLGGDHSYAFGINRAGDVVGYAQLPGEAGGWPGVDHAFLYRDGDMIDLNTVLPPSMTGVELTTARAISDDGFIVGNAVIDRRELSRRRFDDVGLHSHDLAADLDGRRIPPIELPRSLPDRASAAATSSKRGH